jgi:hypothetical protein
MQAKRGVLGFVLAVVASSQSCPADKPLTIGESLLQKSAESSLLKVDPAAISSEMLAVSEVAFADNERGKRSTKHKFSKKKVGAQMCTLCSKMCNVHDKRIINVMYTKAEWGCAAKGWGAEPFPQESCGASSGMWEPGDVMIPRNSRRRTQSNGDCFAMHYTKILGNRYLWPGTGHVVSLPTSLGRFLSKKWKAKHQSAFDRIRKSALGTCQCLRAFMRHCSNSNDETCVKNQLCGCSKVCDSFKKDLGCPPKQADMLGILSARAGSNQQQNARQFDEGALSPTIDLPAKNVTTLASRRSIDTALAQTSVTALDETMMIKQCQ